MQSGLDVPTSMKFKAIEKLVLLDRAKEEKCRIREDMRQAINYFMFIHEALQEHLCMWVLSPGMRAILLNRLQHVGEYIRDVWNVARHYLDGPSPVYLSVMLSQFDYPAVDVEVNETASTDLYEDIVVEDDECIAGYV